MERWRVGVILTFHCSYYGMRATKVTSPTYYSFKVEQENDCQKLFFKRNIKRHYLWERNWIHSIAKIIQIWRKTTINRFLFAKFFWPQWLHETIKLFFTTYNLLYLRMCIQTLIKSLNERDRKLYIFFCSFTNVLNIKKQISSVLYHELFFFLYRNWILFLMNSHSV
jgi:hypothetical protein